MMKQMMWLMLSGLLVMGVTSCSSDDYDDTALWTEVEEIKSNLAQINSEIAALQILATAVEKGMQIVNTVETPEGHEIIFSDGRKIVLKNGKDGKTAPVLGVKEAHGIYYWVLDGEWIKDDKGNKMPVSGTTPKLAIDGKNYWTVNGEQIKDKEGNPIKASGQDGDSFFKGIKDNGETVTITLTDGASFTLTKSTELKFELDTETITLGYGQSVRIKVIQSGVKYTSLSKPDGWKVELDKDELVIYSPVRPNEYAEQKGKVSIVAVGASSTLVASILVHADSDISMGNAGESEWINW